MYSTWKVYVQSVFSIFKMKNGNSLSIRSPPRSSLRPAFNEIYIRVS